MIGQADRIQRLERGLELFEQNREELPSIQANRELAEQELHKSLANLGEGWDEQKLIDFDLSMPIREAIESVHVSGM